MALTKRGKWVGVGAQPMPPKPTPLSHEDDHIDDDWPEPTQQWEWSGRTRVLRTYYQRLYELAPFNARVGVSALSIVIPLCGCDKWMLILLVRGRNNGVIYRLHKAVNSSAVAEIIIKQCDDWPRVLEAIIDQLENHLE